MGKRSGPDASEYWRIYEELALAHGINTVEMASKLGIPRSTLQAWKDNKTYPWLSVAVRIADIFGVTAEFMVSGGATTKEAGRFEIPSELRSILLAFKKLSPEQLAIARAAGLAAAEAATEQRENRSVKGYLHPGDGKPKRDYKLSSRSDSEEGENRKES